MALLNVKLSKFLATSSLLLLPLKHYDEAGRVKPPWLLYFFTLFICRGVFLVIAQLISAEHTKVLADILYEHASHLYSSAGLGVLGLSALVILSFREKITQSQNQWVFRLIRPLLLCAVILNLALEVNIAKEQNWQFSWLVALPLLIEIWCGYYLIKSKHLNVMLQDWQKSR